MLKGFNVHQEEGIYNSIKYICSRAGISALIQIVCLIGLIRKICGIF